LTFSKTYGDADPDVRAELQLTYTGPTTLTSLVPAFGGGNNSFALLATDALASINSTRPFNENVSLTPYTFSLQAGLNTTLTGLQPTLAITPKSLTITVKDSAVFVTRDPNSAQDLGFHFDGLVFGETSEMALEGSLTRTYNNTLTADNPLTLDAGFDPNNPLPGLYKNVFGLASTPIARHGNYDITIEKGDLTVLAADVLLLTVNSQTSPYGEQNVLANGQAQPGTITAQYCTSRDCTLPLSSLTLMRTAGNDWIATDTTGASMSFSTTLQSLGPSSFSTGGYLNVGSYDYAINNLQSLATIRSNSGDNFSSLHTNAGVLTVSPRELTFSVASEDILFDGMQHVQTYKVQGLLEDDLVGVTGLAQGTAIGSYKSNLVTYGADRANYRVILLNGTLRIVGPQQTTRRLGRPEMFNPKEPLIPSFEDAGGLQATASSAGGANPFQLAATNLPETQEALCNLQDLSNCRCDNLQPADASRVNVDMDSAQVCYQPAEGLAGTSSQSTVNAKR
jgi:hypothetical protein